MNKVSTSKIYSVSKCDAGSTLAEYIAGKLNVSRKKAKRLLDERRVFVNGRLCWMAKHLLKPQDHVEVKHLLKPATSPDVLFRDRSVAVINKPAGLLSLGDGGLVEMLPDELRGFLPAHRLDRETSGCLMLVAGDQAYEQIKEQFRTRKVLKMYRALCLGVFEKSEFTIAKPLDEQSARSEVRLILQGRLAADVEVTIATGRTHQIRRHMAGIRHAVLGDRQYGPKSLKESELRDVPRLMLHAAVIGFSHPVTGQAIRVKAPLPADYKQALKML